VWEAWDRVTAEIVAIKILDPSALAQPRAHRRFLRKVETASIQLSLVDTRTGSTERRAEAATASDVNDLIAAVQRGAAKLFELDAPPLADPPPIGPVAAPSGVGTPASAPVAETAALGATHSSASMALADAGVPLPAERTPVPTYIGFGAAGLAVVAFSAAVIAGVVAKSPPNDETRKEYEEDLERRKDYAAAANVAFAAGGVLSAIAVVAFVWE
jgi:hypothetical protein